MSRVYDQIDRRILDELQSNGRLSVVELAARVNLTKTPCSERVRRMERDGVITGYRAVLDPSQVEMNHVTVVQISLTQTSDNSLDEFNRAIQAIPEVQTCLMIAGHFDYLLQVRTRDISHFREILGEQIGKLPGVMHTHSFAVMETVKQDPTIRMAARPAG